MAPLATLLAVCGIIALLWLDRSQTRISRGNRVPLLWLLIFMSRPISTWSSSPSPDAFDRAEPRRPVRAYQDGVGHRTRQYVPAAADCGYWSVQGQGG